MARADQPLSSSDTALRWEKPTLEGKVIIFRRGLLLPFHLLLDGGKSFGEIMRRFVFLPAWCQHQDLHRLQFPILAIGIIHVAGEEDLSSFFQSR